MDLARVIGSVVATEKDPSLKGVKLCVIQPLDENLKPCGETLIATDTTNKRGRGEIVYFVTSAEASFTSPEGTPMPVDAAICGIVDHVEIARQHIPPKAGPKASSADTRVASQ